MSGTTDVPTAGGGPGAGGAAGGGPGADGAAGGNGPDREESLRARLFRPEDAFPEGALGRVGAIGALGLGAMMLIGGLALWVAMAVDAVAGGLRWPTGRFQAGLYVTILAMPIMGLQVVRSVRRRSEAFRRHLERAVDDAGDEPGDQPGGGDHEGPEAWSGGESSGNSGERGR